MRACCILLRRFECRKCRNPVVSGANRHGMERYTGAPVPGDLEKA